MPFPTFAPRGCTHLFITSFMLADMLQDNATFGAKQLVVSSASSKTAYGTAFCLAHPGDAEGAVSVIGLTSPGNLDFTRGLGCYSEVVSYDVVDGVVVGEGDLLYGTPEEYAQRVAEISKEEFRLGGEVAKAKAALAEAERRPSPA